MNPTTSPITTLIILGACMLVFAAISLRSRFGWVSIAQLAIMAVSLSGGMALTYWLAT